MSDYEPLVERTVICREAGCRNRGVPVVMECGSFIVCGPCGQPITDIDQPLTDVPYQPELPPGTELGEES